MRYLRPTFHQSGLAALLFTLAGLAQPAAAAELFKCGTTYQDRPCQDAAVQQRFSRVRGSFSIEQVKATGGAPLGGPDAQSGRADAQARQAAMVERRATLAAERAR